MQTTFATTATEENKKGRQLTEIEDDSAENVGDVPRLRQEPLRTDVAPLIDQHQSRTAEDQSGQVFKLLAHTREGVAENGPIPHGKHAGRQCTPLTIPVLISTG